MKDWTALVLIAVSNLAMVACADRMANAGTQGELDRCGAADLSVSEIAFDSFLNAPARPAELDTALYEILAYEYDIPPIRSVLEEAVGKYGVRAVSNSLLAIAHWGVPYDGSAWGRGQAAAAYGLLQSSYPESVSALVLPAMLAVPEYPDELREGLVIAAEYIEIRSNPELNRALGVVLCQTATHLSPFVQESEDLDIPGAVGRLAWYDAALRVLRRVVNVLALRENGRQVLDPYLSGEPNPVLAERIRAWLADPDTVPYWPE